MIITQKIFKEYDIRGAYPQYINESTAYALGVAFVKATKAKKIVIGRDTRPESEKVFWPLVAGLAKGGARIIDLGVCATPEVFFAVGQKKLSAGCMVTASHSPLGQTGFKFCDGRGITFGLNTGLAKIADLAEIELKKLKPQELKKNIEIIDKQAVEFATIAKDYRKFALSFIDSQAVAGLKIILDASSGSGARLADMVFAVLPFETTVMNFRPGDAYADHGPNPLLRINQKSIANQIRKQGADLGVIFDGDADRAIFFDEKGKFVEPYYINCLLAEIILKMKKKIRIVVDARLSLAISETINQAGGKVLVHRSGYPNIIRTMVQKKLLFGCENSGHFMFSFGLKKKSNFIYGDAIIPVLLISAYLKNNKIKLSEAVAPISDNYQLSGELNFTVDNFMAVSKLIRKKFVDAIFSEIDGLSATAKNGEWFFNLRPSHTEPLVRLNIEAKNKAILKKIKQEIISLIN